jgi:hypothetical protein
VRRARPVALLLAAALLAGGCSRAPSAAEREAWAADLARIEGEVAALEERLGALVGADPRRASLPQGDVVIAVPTDFLRTLIERVFSDVASRVTLTLSGIRAHKQKTLKKGVPVGDMIVDLLVHEVHGRLAPGKPEVVFASDAITLTLPVEVVDGSGDASVHLLWKGRRLARAVCGDLDVTEKVAGSVKPARYVLSGTLALAANDGEIVGTPRFPETKVQLRVTPSADTWRRVDALLESKRGLCGWVLDRVDVKKILAHEAEEKGFGVKLPLHKIQAFRFPAGLSESVQVRDRPLALAVEASHLRIDEHAVWVGANVRVGTPLPGAAAVPP